MYKVFFADDEASMRAGIRKNIDWDNSEFTLIGEAPDGELALSLMREMMPDILITDVRMPFMDGIELSSQAKKAMPWLKIIILSGHDEFEYAKQAITIGVEEYLLKPVTSEDLMKTLTRVAARIEEEKEELKNIERLVVDSRQIQIERLLSGLLYGSAEIETSLRRADELDLHIMAEFYLIMLIDLYVSHNESYSLYQSSCARVSGILSGWDNVVFFNQGSEKIVCLLKGRNGAALEEEAYTYAQAVKYEVERDERCSASVSIGTIVSEIYDWPKSLSDANMVRRYLDMTNRKRIISLSDIRSGGLMPLREVERLPTFDKLRYASKSDIPQFLDDCFKSFDNSSVASLMFMNYIFVDILLASSKMIAEVGGDANEALSEYSDVNGFVASTAGLDAAKTTLAAILTRAIDFRDSKTGSRYGDIISKAQEYIRQNFDRQDISLHSTAREVNVSPNHFSTVFSQETGETFISFLTKLRLEKAKALLKTTSMRTSDVGYAVGYNDTHYFSYVFKKNTGMTPTEFRK